MNEGIRIDAWLKAKLLGDVAAGGLFYPGDAVGVNARVSGVWSELIPREEQLPAIRFTDLAPADVNTLEGNRILVTGRYLVAGVINVADYGPLVAVSDRIDAVLQRATGAFGGVNVLSCIRESVFRLPEDDGDNHHRHLGGIYRVQASL